MVSKEKLDYSIESLESQGTEEHVFHDPVAAEYWKSVYDGCDYEGAPYFDPKLNWSKQEEKKLIRKLDLKIFSCVFVLFCSLDLVRRNINRAVSDNLLDDLNMNTNDYNTGQVPYLVSFLTAELPGNLLSKRFGCERIIPLQMVIWSILCACQSSIRNKAGFLVLRVLIGLSQGGFIPDNILYLSYYYTSAELPIRLAFFWTAIPLSQIIGTLLASGILEMRGIHELAGWRYLFLIEGLICLGIGLGNWYFMKAGPTQTENKTFKTKPWFNEREVKILVNRVLRDDPLKGDINNRQGVDFKSILQTLSDYDLFPLFIQGITSFIPLQPVTNYISLVLKLMGFSTFKSNVLVIPGQFWFLINMPIFIYISHFTKEKSLCVGLSNVFVLPFILSLVCLPESTGSWVKYALLLGIIAQPYTHAILAANISQYSNTVRARTVGTAIYNMMYQVGSCIATQLYTEDDKPYYHKGNRVLLGICIFNIAIAVLSKIYYIQRNRYKARKWDAMTQEQQQDYLLHSPDKGMKRLDFRFVH